MKVRVNVGCWRARQRVKEERWIDCQLYAHPKNTGPTIPKLEETEPT